MLDFKKPVIDDKQWVDSCLKYSLGYDFEHTFGSIFIWSAAYRTCIARYKDFLICRWGKEDECVYSLPIGCGDFNEAVEQIISDARGRGVKPSIYGITAEYKPLLEAGFPGEFTYSYDDGNFDYIYSVEKMATLKGKKYHGKRNHINNFINNHPDWSFEKIDSSNIGECIELHSNWIKHHSDDSDYSFEFEAVLTALENYERLGFVGGLLKISGRAVAYTMGERLSDEVFVTHFEKAPADLNGAYTVINFEFTKNCLMDYRYVNREEDLGIEGLRKAKQSYYPEILLEKGLAVYNG